MGTSFQWMPSSFTELIPEKSVHVLVRCCPPTRIRTACSWTFPIKHSFTRQNLLFTHYLEFRHTLIHLLTHPNLTSKPQPQLSHWLPSWCGRLIPLCIGAKFYKRPVFLSMNQTNTFSRFTPPMWTFQRVSLSKQMLALYIDMCTSDG